MNNDPNNDKLCRALYEYRLGSQEKYLALKDSVYKHIHQNLDSYRIEPFTPIPKYREQVHASTHHFMTEGKFFRTRDLKEEPEKVIAALTCMGGLDLSIIAKIAIQHQLCGGSILELGTEYHHQKYLEDIDNWKLIGGFAMTEMGKGSNVRCIETTATYINETQQFKIDSPTLSSTKFWIGNVAKWGHIVVLFAKLIYNGQDKGVHAFVVHLRDPKTMRILPNIEIGDCGEKAGWNGVDNAYIRFKGLTIPRENLLNRFANIDSNGNYSCTASSPNKLFAVTLSQLMVGRLLYICAPIQALHIGLRVTYRYSTQRRQFGEKGKPEMRIIDYPSHYKDLMGVLATTVCLEFARNELIKRLKGAFQSDSQREKYHILVSGVKPMVCTYAVDWLGKFRVMCGGNGFSAYNRLAEIRSDMDNFQTAEGDGTVLFQQMAKSLLSNFAKKMYQKGKLSMALEYAFNGLKQKVETNPLIIRNTNPSHLLDPKFHKAILKFWVNKLLFDLGMAVRASKKKGLTTFSAWNENLLTALHLSKAYTLSFILRQAQNAIESCTDSSVKVPLLLCSQIFALSSIHSNATFFLVNGYISPKKTQAIEELLVKLCRKLKDEYAELLIDSCDINDKNLDIPIAKKDVPYIEAMLERAKRAKL